MFIAKQTSLFLRNVLAGIFLFFCPLYPISGLGSQEMVLGGMGLEEGEPKGTSKATPSLFEGGVFEGLSFKELSVAERGLIAQGKEVVRLVDKGGIWPQVMVYRRVAATPKTLRDVFLDYERAPNYIPNLVEAKVEIGSTALVKDVRYVVKLPVLFKVSYLIRNTYEDLGGDCFIIRWNLLESGFAKSADGFLRIEPYGAGESLICYANHVEPATRLVASLRGQAQKEAVRTVDAIVKEAQRVEARK